jgi:hypothetical protein
MKLVISIIALLYFNYLSGQSSHWITYPEDTEHPEEVERMIVMNYSEHFMQHGTFPNIYDFNNLSGLMIIGNDLDYKFQRIPDDVLELPGLQSLYIINTGLEQLDEKLHRHPTISELFLYNNAFLKLNILNGNTRIKKLFCDNNIDAIPHLSGLEELTIFHYLNKGQYALPTGYKRLQSLQKLNLYFSAFSDTLKITPLFVELGTLQNLRKLNIYINNWNYVIQNDLEKMMQKMHPELEVQIYLSVYFSTFDEQAYIAFAQKYKISTSIFLTKYMNYREWLTLPKTTFCFESFNFNLLQTDFPKDSIRSAYFFQSTPRDLHSFSNLKNIHLDMIAFTPDMINTLSRLPHLKTLTIALVKNDFIQNIDFDMARLDTIKIIGNISDEYSALLQEKAKQNGTSLHISHIPYFYMPQPFFYLWE